MQRKLKKLANITKPLFIWQHSRRIAAVLALVLVATTITSILTPSSHVAAVGSIYLTPASPSVVHGSNVTISLRINPTTAVTVVQATVNFNPSSLQYVGIDTSASPFDTNVQQTVSSSSIQLSRAKLDSAGVSSDALIANITFTALPYSGSSPVTISGAEAAYNGAYTDPSSSGATVSFTAGTCPSGQTGTPPSCTVVTTTGGGTTTTTPVKKTEPVKTTTTTTPATTTTPTPAATTPTALQVPSVTSVDAEYTNLVIKATTNVNAQARLVYGASKDALNTQTDLTASGTSHTLTIASGLTPGSQLFYKVVATNGQTQETAVDSVTLKGLSVKIALLDKNISPIAFQEVTLTPSGKTVKTDSKGIATFDNMMPGDYTATVKSSDGKSHAQHVAVIMNVAGVLGAETSAPQSQAAIFDSYTAPNPILHYLPWAIIAVVVIALILLFLSWLRGGRVRILIDQLTRRFRNRKMKDIPVGNFSPFGSVEQTPQTPTPYQPTPTPTPMTPPVSPPTPPANNPFNTPQGPFGG